MWYVMVVVVGVRMVAMVVVEKGAGAVIVVVRRNKTL